MERIEEYKRQVDASWEDQILFLKNALNEFFIPDLADLVEKYTRYIPVEREEFRTLSYGYVDLDDQKEGLWIFYNYNGTKRYEGHYYQDQKEGLWIYYHDNGTKDIEAHYYQNRLEGLWINYYNNGTIMSEGHHHRS